MRQLAINHRSDNALWSQLQFDLRIKVWCKGGRVRKWLWSTILHLWYKLPYYHSTVSGSHSVPLSKVMNQFQAGCWFTATGRFLSWMSIWCMLESYVVWQVLKNFEIWYLTFSCVLRVRMLLPLRFCKLWGTWRGQCENSLPRFKGFRNQEWVTHQRRVNFPSSLTCSIFKITTLILLWFVQNVDDGGYCSDMSLKIKGGCWDYLAGFGYCLVVWMIHPACPDPPSTLD